MFLIKADDLKCNRDVNRLSAVLGVITLGVTGSIVFLLLPMLIGAFTENLALSATQVGLLGSADMTGMFVAAVVATAWIRRYNWRTVALLACALLIVCHFLSGFVQTFTPLFLIRVTAGFAGGNCYEGSAMDYGRGKRFQNTARFAPENTKPVVAVEVWSFRWVPWCLPCATVRATAAARR